MSAGWQVGDLAVAAKTVKRGTNPLHGDPLPRGKVFRVEGVINWFGSIALVIEEHRSLHPTGGYCASSFRKIRPDEHEDCEPEFVELLNRIKRKVSA